MNSKSGLRSWTGRWQVSRPSNIWESTAISTTIGWRSNQARCRVSMAAPGSVMVSESMEILGYSVPRLWRAHPGQHDNASAELRRPWPCHRATVPEGCSPVRLLLSVTRDVHPLGDLH